MKALLWLLNGAPMEAKAGTQTALPPSMFTEDVQKEIGEVSPKRKKEQEGKAAMYEMVIKFPKSMTGLKVTLALANWSKYWVASRPSATCSTLQKSR